MCYILYGATDKAIDQDDYKAALKKSHYEFCIGTKHDIKMCIVNDSYEYRVSDWVCDCEFPVGKKDVSAKPLIELAMLINELKNARNSKCIYISKTWAGRKNKTEKNIHINDIDIVSFLANMDLDCLYRIDFH